MRVWFAALCVVAFACRDRGPAPRLDAVEPAEWYEDQAPLVLVLRGSFEAPVTAELANPSQSRLAPYRVKLVSRDQVIDLAPAEFRGPREVDAALEPQTPPGVYTVELTDPWGRSTPLQNAVTVRRRVSGPPDGGEEDGGTDGGSPDAGPPDAGPPDAGPPDAGPVRAPPQARFAFIHDGGLDRPIGDLVIPVVVDASRTTDSQTAAADIRVSWNFTTNPSAPPWTAWSTTKTESYTFSRQPGLTTVVVAAIDDDGDIGYAARAIDVVSRDTDLCFVTTALSEDDGAFDCSPAGSGGDGVLSLDEAVRIANTTVGNQTIVLSAPSESSPVLFTGTTPLRLARTTQIVGTPGAILAREIIAENGPMTLIGLEVLGPDGKLTVPLGYTIVLLDSHLRDTQVYVAGHLMVERTRFENCAGACITVDGPTADLVVGQSSFVGTGSANGVDVPQCVWNSNTYAVDLIGNTFSGLSTAVHIGAGCTGSTRIVHQTFHANGVAVQYLGGDAHVLRNNIFTAQQAAAVQGCTVPFTTNGRRDHVLDGNASDGCIGTDPGVRRINPQYVSSSEGDFRLRYGSPAVDAAPPIGVDANGPAPNDYLGAAPDFGGRETY